MNQNFCPVVGAVAQSKDVGHDKLNGAVETSSTGITDGVLAEVQQSSFMAPEYFDDFLDRLELNALCIAGSRSEEALGSTFVAISPELGKVFLDDRGLAGLEVALVHGLKGNCRSAASVRVPLEPRPFAARQWRYDHLGQAAVILLSHPAYRLAEELGVVRFFMHDVDLGQAHFCRTHEGKPHIHSHRFDRCKLGQRERLKQAFGRLKLPLRHQIEHTRAVDVAQDADAAMVFFGTLFIYSETRYFFLCKAQHASLNGDDHNAIDSIPGQVRESAHPLGGRANFKQFDHESGCHGGDSAVDLRPGYGQFLESPIAVLELRYTRLDEGLKLAGVQVTPMTLAPAVDVLSLGGVGGVSPDLARLENDFHPDTLIGQRRVNGIDQPRCLQSKQVFVQRGVFRDVFSKFRSPNFARVNEKSQQNR